MNSFNELSIQIRVMKNKLATTLLVLCIASISFAQPAPASAESIVTSAVKRAASEKKKTLIIFHASWCGWCKKMDASIADPSCKELFEKNYVIDHLVVLESKGKEGLENPGGMDYLIKWNGEKEGLPFWVILDDNGEVLADSRRKNEEGKLDNTGCPASEPEVAHFVEVLKKTSKLNSKQLEIISTRFRKNESQ